MTLAALSHLDQLEAESIHVIREVAAEAERPVMLYSMGKDSTCLLHLARRAFYPALPPFPLLHVDTTWKFRDMYVMRERVAAESGLPLIVHRNPEALAAGINPFDHGSQLHTDVWQTQGLKQALDAHHFDAAFDGARRDEEKSRAKERFVSLRGPGHHWDPKNQRPELWHLYNLGKAPGESLRVYPLSNWTELDVWHYIAREQLDVVPLYFAAPRPVLRRNGGWVLVDDARMRLLPGETATTLSVRFRKLGCYPLTGAMESSASNVAQIVQELIACGHSERRGLLIDHDASASMGKKTQEGDF